MTTIQQLLSKARRSIASLDAEILLAHTLKRPREFLITHIQKPVGLFQRIRYVQLVRRRHRGVPLAYLIGYKEFYGLSFSVNTHTLIPRPETELIVERACAAIRPDEKTTIIDVGTGTGCIPIAIAKTIEKRTDIQPEDLVLFGIDISKQALQVAKRNAEAHGVFITYIHDSLLSQSQSLVTRHANSGSSLIITANLPYLTVEQYRNEPSIHHEPLLALVAKDRGLALYKILITQLRHILTQAKNKHRISCYFEIDPKQAEALSSYLHTIFPQATISIHQDLSGRDRVLEARISSTSRAD